MLRSVGIIWGVAGLVGVLGATQASRVWRTDLRIRSFDLMNVGQGSVQATVGIVDEGTEAARSARLELLLPASVGLIRAPSGCRPSPALVANLTGRVTCELGDIPAHAVREITVLISLPPAGSSARFAAIVLSDTPDVIPANNFAERGPP